MNFVNKSQILEVRTFALQVHDYDAHTKLVSTDKEFVSTDIAVHCEIAMYPFEYTIKDEEPNKLYQKAFAIIETDSKYANWRRLVRYFETEEERLSFEKELTSPDNAMIGCYPYEELKKPYLTEKK